MHELHEWWGKFLGNEIHCCQKIVLDFIPILCSFYCKLTVSFVLDDLVSSAFFGIFLLFFLHKDSNESDFLGCESSINLQIPYFSSNLFLLVRNLLLYSSLAMFSLWHVPKLTSPVNTTFCSFIPRWTCWHHSC